MLLNDMSPRTRDQVRRRVGVSGKSPFFACAGLIGVCVLITGCGQSMRDDHARVRGVVIEAEPGDGNLVATAIWSGETFASETRQSRVAAANSDDSISAE